MTEKHHTENTVSASTKARTARVGGKGVVTKEAFMFLLLCILLLLLVTAWRMVDFDQLFTEAFAGSADDAFLAAKNRIEIRAYSRLFPFGMRAKDAAVPELPKGLHPMPDRIFQMLQFHNYQKAANREAMYDCWHESVQALGVYREQFMKFLGAVVKANIVLKTNWNNDERLHQLMEAKFKVFMDRLPQFQRRLPTAITKELHKNPSHEWVKMQLEMTLRRECHLFVKEMCHLLDQMVELEQCGLVHWDSENSCDLYFYTHNILDTVKDMREEVAKTSRRHADHVEHRTTTRTERDMVTEHSYSRHDHEVICARLYDLSGAAAANVPLPERVRMLLRETPPFLKEWQRILVGKEINRRIITRHIRTEESTATTVKDEVTEEAVYKFDPAVTLAFYVVCGWNMEELQPEQPGERRPAELSHRLQARRLRMEEQS